MNTNECTLAQLVDPQYPLNVIGEGGFRGGKMDQLKPLTVRVTDHDHDLGGDQNDDTVPRDQFAIFESCAAGQPWKKVNQVVHRIYRNSSTSVIRTKNFAGVPAIIFDECTVGEEVGIFFHDSTQPSPTYLPYVLTGDPVADAAAYVAFVNGAETVILAALHPQDPTVVTFVANGAATWISVTFGIQKPAVADVILTDADVYYPDYNYQHFT